MGAVAVQERGEQQVELKIADAMFRLALSAIFTLPLVGNRVAQALGYDFFLLADPKIQFFWGSVVQFGAGWSFYVGAYKNLRTGGANLDVLVALGTSAVYGYSVYNTFFNPNGVHGMVRVYYEVSAVLLTLITLGKLLAAVAKGRTSEASKKLTD